MQDLQIIEYDGIRVLTSKQLASAYATGSKQLKQNFANNKKRFIQGKHYILLIGEELKRFKNEVENFDLVAKTTSRFYLWTEKGGLLHAKSLNTDKAWEVYDYLVDFYFRAKEQNTILESAEQNEIRKYIERSIKEAAECAAHQKIGYIRSILDYTLQEERGDYGRLAAVFSLLSEQGRENALSLMSGDNAYE